MADILETSELDDVDKADIELAIKSFKTCWGSVGSNGVFIESIDIKQLWLMFYMEGSLFEYLIAEAVPKVYHDRYLEIGTFEK